MSRYFDCGTLVDGRGDVLDDARVGVEDGTIREVGPQEDVPSDGERVDLSGEVVVPGLVDAHCHLQGLRSMNPVDWVLERSELGAARATADLRRLLRAGFTAVRDVGGTTGLALRDAVDEGEIPGPRIYTSGQSISQTGGHGDAHFLPYEWVREQGLGISTVADGPDECRKEARKRALRNGVDTVEHGFYIDEESIDLFHETGATFVPTLSIMHRIVEAGAEHGVPEYGLAKAREAWEAHVESTRRAYEAGVPIATGTDFIGPDLIPHGENALELELLVEEVGLSEHEALVAATSTAARTVRDDQLGRVAPGAYADLVALDADPRDDISNVREVVAVYKGGEQIEV